MPAPSAIKKLFSVSRSPVPGEYYVNGLIHSREWDVQFDYDDGYGEQISVTKRFVVNNYGTSQDEKLHRLIDGAMYTIWLGMTKQHSVSFLEHHNFRVLSTTR